MSELKKDDFSSTSEGVDPHEDRGLDMWYGGLNNINMKSIIAGLVVLAIIVLLGILFL